MSYDVNIPETFEANYTSNVSGMWYDSIHDTGKGGGLRELEGMTGKEAHSVLSKAFDKLNQMPRLNYDAPNGWGTNEGGLIFMARIMAACAMYPDDTVSVCA